MSKVKRSAHSSEDASSSSGTSSSLSSDEEVDVRDLKPIKEYLSDRRELARQLFKSVKADKIQMMLPQILKKMDLGQLEEWCANELSGMSKTRILCILNGKTMLDSSDTSESDDSGPSLEIISDTEEWFSDEDICKKEEGLQSGKVKIKKDRAKLKGKSQLHKKNDAKPNPKKVDDNTYKNVQIKKEEEAEAGKEKDGDSLLDLLELEMRARAIRALIRKEEDVIPNTSKAAEGNGTTSENNVAKTVQDEQKEKENCRRQLERIISAQQTSPAEDEDVVLVVQPTPTIELLSSDSEGESHGGVRINKKLQNERVMESEKNKDRVENGEAINVNNVNTTENSKENKVTEDATEVQKELSTHKVEVSKRVHSNNVDNKDASSPSKSNGKKRKLKRKSHTKEQQKNSSSETDKQKTKLSNGNPNKETMKSDACLSVNNTDNVKLNEKEHENNIKPKITHDNSLLDKQINVEVSGKPDKVIVDEEKSIDMDEIIDLDDYGDDMDDIVNNENDKVRRQVTENKSLMEAGSAQKSNGTETWASRYYQTEDVQNVIKESKIQSEIRKRLRERQRLSKLSTSPNLNSPGSPTLSESTNNKTAENNPLGSVDEYLALKHTAAISLSIGDSNSSTGVVMNNGVSTNTCTTTDTTIESDHTLVTHCNEKSIDGNINLSHNLNVDNSLATNNETFDSAVNDMNPG